MVYLVIFVPTILIWIIFYFNMQSEKEEFIPKTLKVKRRKTMKTLLERYLNREVYIGIKKGETIAGRAGGVAGDLLEVTETAILLLSKGFEVVINIDYIVSAQPIATK